MASRWLPRDRSLQRYYLHREYHREGYIHDGVQFFVIFVTSFEVMKLPPMKCQSHMYTHALPCTCVMLHMNIVQDWVLLMTMNVVDTIIISTTFMDSAHCCIHELLVGRLPG